MEFIIDTVNLEEIREAVQNANCRCHKQSFNCKSNITSELLDHMRAIREIIGKERSLHIQVISKECNEIVKEAHRILKEVDDEVYIKVPVSYEGIKAIKILKAEGVHITATAVYRSYCKLMLL